MAFSTINSIQSILNNVKISVNVTTPVSSLSISAKNSMIYSGTHLQAGALGVRLLYSNYSGPVLQIKNGTNGTPTDFYADSNGNLGTQSLATGTSLTTFLSGETAYITKWYDQTGNSNHGIAVNTPIYNTTKKTVDFASGYFSLPDNSFPTGNLAYTYIFTPVDYTLPGSYRSIVVYSGGSHNDNCVDCAGAISYYYQTYGNFWYNSSWITNSTTDNLYGKKVADCYNGTNASGRSFYFNNTLETDSSVSQIDNFQRAQSGSNCFIGHIGPYNGGGNLRDYNGTLQFFYWAPIQLTVADLTILCNTPTS